MTAATLAVLLASVGACGAPSFGDFRARVRSAAGPGAEFCGDVASGTSEYRANACLAQAFGNGTGAYAIFRTQGYGSTGAVAPVTRDGRVSFHSFDGDSAGDGSDEGEITVRECRNPRLAGRTDTRVFACG